MVLHTESFPASHGLKITAFSVGGVGDVNWEFGVNCEVCGVFLPGWQNCMAGSKVFSGPEQIR
jgi:hypothetical protein